MLRRTCAVLLLVIGTIYGPGMPVGVACLLTLMPLSTMHPLLWLFLGLEAIVGTGIFLGGVALWGWHRRRKVLGVVLTVTGAFGAAWCWSIVVLLSLRHSTGQPIPAPPVGQVVLAGAVAAASAAIYLATGILLIRSQRRRDRAGATATTQGPR